MKLASEAPFPYGYPGLVCYIEVHAGRIEQVTGRDGIRAAADNALAGRSTVYATWPGQYRTDLFIIDRPELLAEAVAGRRTVA